jgi:hypothetical protein
MLQLIVEGPDAKSCSRALYSLLSAAFQVGVANFRCLWAKFRPPRITEVLVTTVVTVPSQ